MTETEELMRGIADELTEITSELVYAFYRNKRVWLIFPVSGKLKITVKETTVSGKDARTFQLSDPNLIENIKQYCDEP